MRLDRIRQHYRSSDTGRTWIPKKSFKSAKEIPFRLKNRYDYYNCDFCGDIHVGRLKEKIDVS